MLQMIQHDLPSHSRKRLRLFPIFAGILLLSTSGLRAADYPPRPAGPVAHFARCIDAPTQQKIADLAEALWEQAGFGLVVATFPSLGSYSIDEYAPELYKRWGIGKKDSAEGALVLLSMDPRRVRIEVGYGAEGYINDAKAGRIIDDYGLQSFKRNDFSAGLLNVSIGIAKTVAQEKGISLTMPTGFAQASPSMPPQHLSTAKIILILIVLALLLGTPFGRSFLWMMILMSLMGGGRGRSGGGFGGGFGGGGFGGGSSGGGGASRGF